METSNGLGVERRGAGREAGPLARRHLHLICPPSASSSTRRKILLANRSFEFLDHSADIFAEIRNAFGIP
jgi:hypothetical protein